MKYVLRRAFCFTAVLALLLIEPARPQTSPVPKSSTQAGAARPAPLEVPKLRFEKYTLDNGLEVILSEDHRLPMVAVNLWYHVGPANELPGRTGFAHLFEHMMFEGSKHVPGNTHFRLLESAGSADINGTTDFDRTNYFETLPANQLELALWLESDRMGYLPDQLDQASLSNQQDVVRNERRQSLENVPYGIVEEGMVHLLYPKHHPYYASVIGSHADIQAAKLDDVRNFFKLYYAPNNASLAIVGDFDPGHARELVEKHFGPLKRGAEVPKIQVKTPAISSERRAVIQDHVQLPAVYMAWLTSPIFKPGDAEADLAARILAGGHSSRLYKKLVYDKQIALEVRANQQSLILGSMFEIQATAKPGHTAEELEKAINEELEALRKDGPTEAELARARNGVETGIITRLETLGGFGGVADRLNRYNHYLGTPDFLAADINRYEKASLETVKMFAQGQLGPDARVVLYGVPGTPDLGPDVPTPKTVKGSEGQGSEAKGGGEPVNPDAAWRAAQPKPGAVRPLHLPVPVQFKLSNGLTVLYNERPGLPVVSARLILRGGSGANPAERPGLASMTAGMLQQGTATLSATQIADRTADLGATLESEASADESHVSVRSLSPNFPPALALLADVALHPNFPKDEIERQRSQRLGRLVQEKDQPFSVALRVAAAVLYGPQNPYGYPDSGTEESVKATSHEDLRHFWEQNYRPNDAALIVTGKITQARLKELAEKNFGAWKSAETSAAKTVTPEPVAARVIVVNRAGAPQSTVLCLELGPARSTPDYTPLEVMNSELGGLFSSRINLNLREQHGYTYGAGSFFNYHRAPGPFIVYSEVRSDVTAPAITEMFNELRRMRDTSMAPEELTMSKDSIARSLPGRFETGNATAAAFAELFTYDLPLDFYTNFPDKLNAVTTSQAQSIAQKYIFPDKMIVLVVGDRAKIEADLKKLNLGPLEIRDTNGKVVQ
ncbi:MAG TPA: pitrilysin family protein [Candidatus Dormibacteraeota bacterium]|nr:pitrilysin family protein [Candidatus Dormibacteraeota bacterium]